MKNKNRLIYDINTAYRDKRPVTKELIEKDIKVKDYKSAKELFNDLLDVLKFDKEEVYDYLINEGILDDSAKGSWEEDVDYSSEHSNEDIVNAFFHKFNDDDSVKYLITSFLYDWNSAWGTGEPNILYICVNGYDVDDYDVIEYYKELNGLHLNSATEQEVIDALLKNED